jgi:Glycine-rich domain-containing protein-like
MLIISTKETNMTQHDFAAIEELDLEPIKVKLMHEESGEGWSLERANAVEKEYRRFLYLMKKFPEEQTAPLMDVDTFWHYHILDTMKYAVDCDKVFGYFLHHFPYIGLRGEDDEKVHHDLGERMKELYEATFGEAYIREGATAWSGRAPVEANGQAAWSGAATAQSAQTAWSGAATGKPAQTAWSGAATAKSAQTAWSGAATGKSAQTAWSGAATGKSAQTAWSGAATGKPVQTAWSGAATSNVQTAWPDRAPESAESAAGRSAMPAVDPLYTVRPRLTQASA